MAKKRRKRKKVNFSERRYSKNANTKAKETMLPDEVFWPAYYGVSISGIAYQFKFYSRWHAIKCLEDGFKDGDEGLLQARKELTGLLDLAHYFLKKHQTVLESPAFKKRKALLHDPPFPQRSELACEWENRSIRADLEIAWYTLNWKKEFHKQMGFSSVYANDMISWNYLQVGGLEDMEKRWWTLPRGRLRGLDFKTAFALVGECADSELHEINAMEDGLNNQELQEHREECMGAFLYVLAKQRAAYIEEHPNVEELDKKQGHTNFGLDIDIPSLPTYFEEEEDNET